MTSVAGLLAEIAGIGRDPGTGGYRRFVFTREDAALAEWFDAACRARGLDVTVDRCGNQWAWWGDPDTASTSGSGVVTGSHLDSVPDGGAYDGPLGVAAALVAVDLLRAGSAGSPGSSRSSGSAGPPARPLGVVRFVDEEGARFGLPCSGSRLLTGAAAPDRVLALRDGDGVGYAEALTAAGLTARHAGRDDETLRRIGAFVELHVEQGRALATPELNAPIGVASRIRPHGRWRVELAGRADHAGTTLLGDRDDPMLALAGLVVAVRSAAERHGALGTVGKVDVRPNAVNAIPSRVVAWIDVRADVAEQVDAVLDDVRTGRDTGRPVDLLEESRTAATDFDDALTRRVACVAGAADAAGAAGVGVPMLASGAGHDAGVLSQAGIASSMLFVRNPSGVSHSPAEHAEPEDCETGARALAAVLGDLCAVPYGVSEP